MVDRPANNHAGYNIGNIVMNNIQSDIYEQVSTGVWDLASAKIWRVSLTQIWVNIGMATKFQLKQDVGW